MKSPLPRVAAPTETGVVRVRKVRDSDGRGARGSYSEVLPHSIGRARAGAARPGDRVREARPPPAQRRLPERARQGHPHRRRRRHDAHRRGDRPPEARRRSSLLHDLYDPASPSFHHFLTPRQYAKRFGPDATATKAWIESQGLHIDYESSAHDYILASGSTGQVEQLTHTTIGDYTFAEQSFIANDAPPRMPANLPDLQRPRPQHLRALPHDAESPDRDAGQADHRQPHARSSSGTSTSSRPTRPARACSVAILGEGATD